MEPKTKLAGHPDEVFGKETHPPHYGGVPGQGKSAIIKPLLSEEVAALAASLNLPTPTGNQAYDPDAFVQAIRKTHDQLMEVKRILTEQNEEQRRREAELKAREEAVAFREKRITAHETLTRKGWWRL